MHSDKPPDLELLLGASVVELGSLADRPLVDPDIGKLSVLPVLDLEGERDGRGFRFGHELDLFLVLVEIEGKVSDLGRIREVAHDAVEKRLDADPYAARVAPERRGGWRHLIALGDEPRVDAGGLGPVEPRRAPRLRPPAREPDRRRVDRERGAQHERERRIPPAAGGAEERHAALDVAAQQLGADAHHLLDGVEELVAVGGVAGGGGGRGPQPLDAGAAVSTNANQTVPRPLSNQRTAIQAISTESHIVDAPISKGLRVSPLPRKLPLLTNHNPQNGSAMLIARSAAVPDWTTAGSAEKICITRSLRRNVSTPPVPIQINAQRSAI